VRKASKRTPKKLVRRQSSRLERERRFQKILIWSVAVVAVLVVGLLGYGIVFEKVIKAREPVAIVSGTPITTADFQARVGYQRMRMTYEFQALYQQSQSLDQQSAGSIVAGERRSRWRAGP
jgi:hypothetical protein